MSAIRDKAAVVLAQPFKVSPTMGSGPGGPQIQHVINLAALIGLGACVLGLIVSVATWAIAHHSNSARHEGHGKLGVIISVAAAALIAAAPALIGWGFNLGGGVTV